MRIILFIENAALIKKELHPVEVDLSITFKETTAPSKVMDVKSQLAFVRAVATAHSGVYAMSRSVEGLVETSNNIANVKVENGKIAILCMTRSSVDNSKHDPFKRLLTQGMVLNHIYQRRTAKGGIEYFWPKDVENVTDAQGRVVGARLKSDGSEIDYAGIGTMSKDTRIIHN